MESESQTAALDSTFGEGTSSVFQEPSSDNLGVESDPFGVSSSNDLPDVAESEDQVKINK